MHFTSVSRIRWETPTEEIFKEFDVDVINIISIIMIMIMIIFFFQLKAALTTQHVFEIFLNIVNVFVSINIK